MKGTLRKSCAVRSGLHRGATERARTHLSRDNSLRSILSEYLTSRLVKLRLSKRLPPLHFYAKSGYYAPSE